MKPECQSLVLPALIGLLVFAAPSPASAQPKPNCKDPQTQIEMTMCAGLEYKAADRELNAAYRRSIASMKETDSNLPAELKGAEKALRASQRAWIPFRDKSCEAYGFQARGGSMESMLVAMCLADMTRKRTKELKDITSGLAN